MGTQNEKEEMASYLKEIKAGQDGMRSDIEGLKEIVCYGFSAMTDQYQSIKGDLEGIRSLATSSFEMLQEMHYLDGIENIDSAHAVFFNKTIKDGDISP